MAGALSMGGHIDGVFRTVAVDVTVLAGGYVDGIWTETGAAASEFNDVTIQPLSDRELDFALRTNERITDTRKLYINSGNFAALVLGATARFSDQDWKIIKTDVRPWRNYAKIIVDRIDNQ